jgi:hypothetical protein
MKRPAILLWLLSLILVRPLYASGEGGNVPFQPGERLRFMVYWSFIPAGEATLEILPREIKEGVECFHFRATARTFEYIDPFYMVRDTIEAYADGSMNRSIAFTKLQQGKRKRDIAVHFDWEKGEARYSESGQKREPVPIQRGTFDPLSIFYAFRVQDLAEGKVMVQPVTDGKRTVVSTARVIRREKIRVAGREYDTYLVEPEMKNIGGVFEKSEKSNLQIWVTADRHRIPVRIRSAVRVGSFVAELVSGKE